jgi:hypothetical protein
MRTALKSLYLILLVVLLFGGCATMQNRWKNTEAINTIAAYENFLKRYPEGTLADEARSRIEKLYFEHARAEDTISSYEDFLKRYPEGVFAAEATSRRERLSREILIEELYSLLPNAKPVPLQRNQYLWKNLKLYIKIALDKSYSSLGLPQVFFQELTGNCDIASAKTPFKIVGDELKIADGAVVQLKSGERFFFLEGTWRKLGEKNIQVDTCLQNIREFGEKEVHDYERQGPPGVRYSLTAGTLE